MTAHLVYWLPERLESHQTGRGVQGGLSLPEATIGLSAAGGGGGGDIVPSGVSGTSSSFIGSTGGDGSFLSVSDMRPT